MSSIDSKGKISVTIPDATTKYFEVGGQGALIHSVQIRWPDAVSSASITFETSNYEPSEAPVGDAGAAGVWFEESSVPIAGPDATAAGGTMIHLGNLGAQRCRLKVVTAAVTSLEILTNGKH
jgi:hypothetical protein